MPVITLAMVLNLAGKTDEQTVEIPEVIPVKSEPTQIAMAFPLETLSAAQIIETPTPVPAPRVVERYAEITMTEEELRELAEIIYHEARGEPPEGQQAVAEVVFNRVIADNFPDTVHDVLHQGEGTAVPQFSTIRLLGTADPLQEQYDAINAALYGPSILPADVVFFSRKGENDRIWGQIGNHVFCYQYDWD
jgi:N-acetylmuramoyl-L-alanine amidase